MKSIALALVLCVPIAAAAATRAEVESAGDLPAKLKTVHAQALAGDYQAMRNMAYSYATQLRMPVAACGWYLAITRVHAAKFTEGDSGNVYVYCRPLGPVELHQALMHAARLHDQIAPPK